MYSAVLGRSFHLREGSDDTGDTDDPSDRTPPATPKETRVVLFVTLGNGYGQHSGLPLRVPGPVRRGTPVHHPGLVVSRVNPPDLCLRLRGPGAKPPSVGASASVTEGWVVEDTRSATSRVGACTHRNLQRTTLLSPSFRTTTKEQTRGLGPLLPATGTCRRLVAVLKGPGEPSLDPLGWGAQTFEGERTKGVPEVLPCPVRWGETPNVSPLLPPTQVSV